MSERRALDVVAIGEVLVDLTPTDRPRAGHWSFSADAGGAPANVAVGVARLHGASGIVGAVGSDGFGTFLWNTLLENGVNCEHLSVVSSRPTTAAVVTPGPEGARDFSFYRAQTADTQIPSGRAVVDYVNRARMVYFGSVSLVTPETRAAVFNLIESTRGPQVFFDPNYRPFLWEDEDEARTVIGEALRKADFVKLSEDELEFLTGSSTAEAARAIEGDHSLVVVTRGARGCTVVRRDGTASDHPARPRDAVDTTGAGDAFAAAFMTGLAGGATAADPESIDEIVVCAQTAAGLSVTRRGAIPSLPTLREVRAECRVPRSR